MFKTRLKHLRHDIASRLPHDRKARKVVLIELIILLTIACGLLSIVSFQLIKQFIIPDITISQATTNPVNAENRPYSRSINYGEAINQLTGESTLTWGANTVTLLARAQLSITQSEIVQEQGVSYFNITTPTTLRLGEATFSIEQAQFIFDTATQQLIVIAGSVKLTDDRVAETNMVIDFAAVPATITQLERSLLTENTSYARLITYLTETGQLPAALGDTTAPALSNVAPANGSSTTAESIEITGTTEPGVKVIINGVEQTPDAEGNFKFTLALNPGANTLDITAEDSSGNKTTLSHSYTRSVPTPTTPGGCNADQATANSLIALINQHRAANGLGALTATSALNSAATGHSCYMQATGNFSHTGLGGSSFSSRCSAAGTNCDAENIAFTTPASAQALFNLWVNSAIHNQNMLGSHTQIGVGVAGVYATAVFF